ncbi:MAG: 1-acyl-sn-glycerol-3-phosphate acyltransferase [Flavobacteriia bacterium]|jgi:1-acyl-sn-glycerol-3-phosphate acyltransferase
MMRILYFLFKIFLQYPFRLFFPRIKLHNAPKRWYGRTIYVSNHASSFLDPIIIGVLQRPIVFFMTRSDVFKSYIKPITWAVHMLPIYREQDGEDTKSKNFEVFQKCTRILSHGRNLLIFGEGFTDDVFVRRLKPVKKGAARIGFQTLETLNWSKKIYMAAIGINYGDPKFLGSDLVISNSDRFCLNDYKEMYLENPAKAITEVTKRVEILMQEQLTHVENKDWVFFHEQICRLRRNGLNIHDTDFNIPLRTRWENSKKLAHWINGQDLQNNAALQELKEELDSYFKLQKRMKLEEKFVHELATNKKFNFGQHILKLIIGAIFVPLGLVQFYVPYTFVKGFVEKSFKRNVFWSSVKIMMGTLVLALWNVPITILLDKFIIHNSLIAWVYFFISPFIGLITYLWFRELKMYKTKKILAKMDLSAILKRRENLVTKIENLIPKI